ncbi:MAG: electron transfer flavoprotein subunit alpha, partial [Anaerolineae bacterium]
MSVLVYIAQHQGQAKPVSWEIMGKARALADRLQAPLVGLVIGHGVGAVAAEAIAYGADRVVVADD